MRRLTIIVVAVLYFFSGSVTGAMGCNCSAAHADRPAETLCHHDGSPIPQPAHPDCCNGHCCHGSAHFVCAIVQAPEVPVVPSHELAGYYLLKFLTCISGPLHHPPICG